MCAIQILHSYLRTHCPLSSRFGPLGKVHNLPYDITDQIRERKRGDGREVREEQFFRSATNWAGRRGIIRPTFFPLFHTAKKNLTKCVWQCVRVCVRVAVCDLLGFTQHSARLGWRKRKKWKILIIKFSSLPFSSLLFYVCMCLSLDVCVYCACVFGCLPVSLFISGFWPNTSAQKVSPPGYSW